MTTNAHAHIIDGTAENFEQAVLQNSRRAPVLVDFWAPWCGPCRSLLPIVTRLAEEYAGQFVLVKINIDEQPELATRFGVRSVPTVKLVRDGQLVDEFMGALPEGAVREFLDRHVEKESDRVLRAAAQLREAGDTESARRMVEELLAAEPENGKARLARAELLIASGQYGAGEAELRALPLAMQSEPQVRSLLAALEFARVVDKAPPASVLEARIAANARDSEARHQLAALRAMGGDYAGAMEQLLELMKSDRGYGNDAGRNGLLKLFEMVDDEALVSRYRRLMFTALH